MPCKALEQGACKVLKGHIFTISSGNKGKDKDMVRTSKEKMATYIGTKLGDDGAQEWTSKKQITLKEPQSTPNPFWIGMVRESMPPRTKSLSSLPA
jgi:hypothetical protein